MFLPQVSVGKPMKKRTPNLGSVGWQARAVWKLVLSMFKDEWTIDDYPIRARFQPTTEPFHAPRLKPHPWIASIINWPVMSGGGNTKLEALEDLRKNFDHFRATKGTLPRPGTSRLLKNHSQSTA